MKKNYAFWYTTMFVILLILLMVNIHMRSNNMISRDLSSNIRTVIIVATILLSAKRDYDAGKASWITVVAAILAAVILITAFL